MSNLTERVAAWIDFDPDPEDRATLRDLLDRGELGELRRRFEHPLRFGTAGLRGEVMAGPAGMNRCTVRRATYGVAKWLADRGDRSRGVVVGRDARHGSSAFLDEVVAVLLGAGVSVFELTGPVPTPLVAYGVRELGALAGIMITASHNPAHDNGFKLYDHDGAQIIAPHDAAVEEFATQTPRDVALGERGAANYHVRDDLVERYAAHVVSRFAPEGGSDLALTYTPLHGVGGALMTRLFTAAGYRCVSVVDEQFRPDPDFPTLEFPNPEEPGALDLALARARDVDASLVFANDPDADRLGVAVVDDGEWRVLRGDEVGWLLAATLIDEAHESDVVATSVVSSTLLETMAARRGVTFVRTLTGFKWIARAGAPRRLLFGYEEALGYAVDDAVADKDGLSAALALARLAHDLAAHGGSLARRLDEIEDEYGVHATAQVVVRLASARDAAGIVARLREHPPSELGGQRVRSVGDLASLVAGAAPGEGVVFALDGDARVIARPSGTEAKLKFYLEVIRSGAGPLDERRRSAWLQMAALRDAVAELAAQ